MDYECNYIYDSDRDIAYEDFELRTTILKPRRHSPTISFIFTTGIKCVVMVMLSHGGVYQEEKECDSERQSRWPRSVSSISVSRSISKVEARSGRSTELRE